MNKSRSKPIIILLAILLASVLLAIYVETRSRLAPGQEPLTDIQNIGTLRAQFNQDAGKTRLILILSPT